MKCGRGWEFGVSHRLQKVRGVAKPGLFQTLKWEYLLLDLPDENPAHILGHLEMMWKIAHAAADPVFGSHEDIEVAAKWDGEKGLFAQTLENRHFIDCQEDGTFRLHDYEEHAPHYVRERLRKRRERTGKSYPVPDCPGQMSTNADSPGKGVPSPTFPSPSLPDPCEAEKSGGDPDDPSSVGIIIGTMGLPKSAAADSATLTERED